MGIGVSYTGSNGERRNFTAGNVSALESAMNSVSPRSGRMRGVNDALFNPNLNTKKDASIEVKSGSAIVKDYRGELCLRGEEADPLVDGVRIYGSLNGKKGFFTFAEADPPVEGKLIGKWLNVDTICDGDGIGNGEAKQGWSIPLSRTSCGVKDGKLCVYNYFRQLKFTKDGRAIGVTAESEMLVGKFETGGKADWCVMPEFDGSGILSALRFGTSSLLDEYAEQHSITPPTSIKKVETVNGCPYADEDE